MPVQEIAVITDSEALRKTLVRHAGAVFGEARVRSMLYYQSDVHLPSLIRDCEGFVLELFRAYPGGIRAEGVALAEKLLQRGKRVLVVSPLFCSSLASCFCYWDTSSLCSLSDAMDRLFEYYEDLGDGIRRLVTRFQPSLRLPEQH